MGINVRDYLIDLEARKIKRDNDGFYCSNDDRISRVEDTGRFSTYNIDGQPFILKRGSLENFSLPEFIAELNMGKVYNDLGVNSAEYYPIYLMNEFTRYKMLKLASQDLKKLDDNLELVNPLDILKNIYSYGITNSWKVLYCVKIKDQLLEYMTEECFDKMIRMFLLDTLTTQGDRHSKNYFFVRNKQSKLCEDIIAIDNEVLNINQYSLSKMPTSESFDNFLTSRELMYFPLSVQTGLTYEEVNRELNKLISSGNLSQEQIDFIKSVLDYDIALSHGRVADEYNIPNRQLFLKHEEMLERLWDYNRTTLELD